MRLALLLCALLVLSPTVAFAQKNKAGKSAPVAETSLSVDEQYMAMVEAAKADPQAVDFAAMREVYQQSTYYRGYDSDGMTLRAPGANPTPEEARAFVDANFAVLSTHNAAVQVLGYKRGTPEWTIHADAFNKLADVIEASGDGKTPETAWQVLTVSEEYDLMNYMEIETISQNLVQNDGRAYDVFQAKPKAGGAEFELWFDVTVLIDRASRP